MKINKILIAILILSVFAVGTITFVDTVEAAVKTIDNENKEYTIESKEKSARHKVTFNANGGKLGNKNSISTTVKKGSKIGTLPKTPKLAGHTFKGWYTKKSGGAKISTNTKINKKMTLYAQWTKKASSNAFAAEEKKLVGRWKYEFKNEHEHWHSDLTFYKNGTFRQNVKSMESNGNFTGNYRVLSKGKTNTMSVTNISSKDPSFVSEYVYSKSGSRETLYIPHFGNPYNAPRKGVPHWFHVKVK